MPFQKGKSLSHVDIIVEDEPAAQVFFLSMFDWAQTSDTPQYDIYDTKTVLYMSGNPDQKIGLWIRNDWGITCAAIPFYFVTDVIAFRNELVNNHQAEVEILVEPTQHPRDGKLCCIFKYIGDPANPVVNAVVGVIAERP